MSDVDEKSGEPVSMQAQAAGGSEGSGGTAPARRPRKRRRYRKTTRTRTPKAATGETPVESASTENEPGEYEEPQPIAQAPEPEYSDGDDGSDSDDEGESSESESSAPAAATDAGAAGGDAPAPVKKRRHRGGRRHRRRRTGAAAPAGTESTSVATEESPVERPVEKEIKPVHVHAHAPAPTPAPAPQVAQHPNVVKPAPVERSSAPIAPVKPDTAAQLGLKLPGIDAGRAKKAMITFLQEQRDIRGRVNAVLELSGEINSITAATVTVEALGSGHVTLCFFMDGEAGNQTRRDHARMVASRLGKELEIKDLRPILQTVYAGEAVVDPGRRMTRMAVEKQAWLLDLAEMQKAFLVQSLNKTERLLGIGSPSLEDARLLSPLADVYQSQVYELAKACSIPAAVVDPTREFVQAAELGMKTQEIDGWLYQMLDVKVSLAKLMELGAEEPKLKKLYQQLKLAAQNKQRMGWDGMTGFYQPRPWLLQGR